jgi:aryl-alcohol dehydrogenase-like predicted oxidoreductase
MTATLVVPPMPTKALGRSGLMVSRICLGTMLFGGATSDAEARRIVDDARAHGVNFIDTANNYADFESEKVVGRAIKDTRRQWVLATKVGNPLGGPLDGGLSRRHMIMSCDDSLMRLGTDVIDLFYVHKVDANTSWDSVVATFGDLIKAGKIREWGLSNVRAWQIADICHIADKLGIPRPAALQPYYNLMNRQPEVEVLPAAQHFGLGVVPYSPVARGVLTGKYAPNVVPEAGSRAARKDKRMLETEWRVESFELADKIKAHTAARGISVVHWAVAWVLANGAITSSIAGPRTFEQWQGYIGAANYQWTADDEAFANSLVPTGHPSTPGFNDPAYPITGRFSTVA